MDDDFELREEVIERFDVYDLVELLGLTVENLVDNFGILDNDSYRELIEEALYT